MLLIAISRCYAVNGKTGSHYNAFMIPPWAVKMHKATSDSYY